MDWKALLGRVEKVGFSKLRRALEGRAAGATARVWLSFSGAGERLRAQPTLYAELVARCDGDGDGCRGDVRDQIEKDLRRTEIGPGSPSTSSKIEPISAAKVESLRRVLLAFASFNPDVSYVQGMNFIAAGLLATLPEDASFWMLVLIVEQWLPGHFGPRMMGNHVDCRVLGLLTTQHLPRLADGLKSLEVSTQLSPRGGLCFWASVHAAAQSARGPAIVARNSPSRRPPCLSVLPPEALLRIWDVLFVLGPTATCGWRWRTCTGWRPPSPTRATWVSPSRR